MNRRATGRVLKLITHVGALLPLVLILWDWWFYQLSADWIREITLRTGKPAIILLMLTLAITPLSGILGWKQLIPLRRLLGLYTFLYVAVHLTIFVAIDYGLSLELIGEAILEKRYALVGFAAFLLLLPLALTSNRWSMKRLGRRWKQLHKLTYIVGVLAVIHYLWLVKRAYTQPLLFAAILALLFVLRVPRVRRALIDARRRRGKRGRLAESAAATD